jgi:hypothetical protein
MNRIIAYSIIIPCLVLVVATAMVVATVGAVADFMQEN